MPFEAPFSLERLDVVVDGCRGESELLSDFANGRSEAFFLPVAPDEIENLTLAYCEFFHRTYVRLLVGGSQGTPLIGRGLVRRLGKFGVRALLAQFADMCAFARPKQGL